MLEVIRTNFHSLQLKLYEGLEIFEKHEKASECIVDDLVSFFITFSFSCLKECLEGSINKQLVTISGQVHHTCY